ncbi:2-methylcitrate dehydratase PrpD [Paenibacillus polymyxa]|uniref:MmgE/PrpD family protein n=1 Tax=Paenibacillus polymyxa TaxID=1406 RepID=UPI002792EB04|nr:MmgE/PrpD family protein [Paenibacillus polymyxa]MDQ0049433.1 2-methylcitrate dehydratase PrpD [Paenibacillus polymyxa]
MELNNLSLTSGFVDCIQAADPLASREAVHMAKMGLVDFIASCHAASGDISVQKLKKHLDMDGGAGLVPVIGQNMKTAPLHATLLNGFIGHALDFDDVHSDVRGHPSTVILPVLFSLAASKSAKKDLHGKRLLASYIIGVEVMARLGQAIGKDHYAKGWHNTGTLGAVAAAVAGAYFLGMSHQEMCRVIGLAATQASGLRVQFGTEAKPLHAGLAAQAALQSILFTEYQLSGTAAGLDQELGFFAVYGQGDQYAAPFLLDHWQHGAWKIANPGLWFKLYPFCSAGYHGADAALRLVANYPIDPERIKQINIIFPQGGDAALVQHTPLTGEQGRFSIEYIVGLILLHYPLSIGNFQAQPIAEDVRMFMNKIKRRYSDVIQPVPNSIPKDRFTIVEIITDRNEIWSERVDAPKGSALQPLTDEEMQYKLKTCLQNDQASRRILQYVDGLEDYPVSGLLSLL